MTDRPPICFYHSADFDGICSGAIVKKAIPKVELRGYDYGQEFPWEEIKGRHVIMVDVSLQPFSEMERLAKEAGELTWIDHHKTAIEEKLKSEVEIFGVRIEGRAACELTWQWFFSDRLMPRAVQLLGRYDVWDHEDPDVLPFQYGARAHIKNGVEDSIWRFLLDNDDAYIWKIVGAGRLILEYQIGQDAIAAKAKCFETIIKGPPDADGWRRPLGAIACNHGPSNSKVFDSVFDPAKHDLMMPFYLKKDGRWKVSLYSEKPDVDCGAIAKQYGGGGHRGAAGFRVDSYESLPFHCPGEIIQ